MNIYFLRHGLAEERGKTEDNLRCLTVEGIKALEDNLPYLVQYLKQKEKGFSIWSSPLIRAKQTAKILANLSGELNSQEYAFLASGHLEDLQKALRTVDQDIAVVMVGHEPYLSFWLYQICKKDVYMKKGSVAGIQLTKLEPCKGRLLFYHSLKELKKLSKYNKRRKNQMKLRKLIEEQINLIIQRRDDLLQNVSAITSVHQLRVSMRRFRAMLSYLKPVMDKAIYQTLQNDFRKLTQELAYARELDVLMKEWQALQQEQRIQETPSSFLELIKKSRKDEESRLVEYFSSPVITEFFKSSLFLVLEAIDWLKVDNWSWKDQINEVLDDQYKTIKKQYASLGDNQLAQIHKLRIQCKKFRYQCDIFQNSLSKKNKKHHQSLKTMQDVLGVICDANRNSQAVAELIESVTDQKTLNEAAMMIRHQQEKSHFLFNQLKYQEIRQQPVMENQPEDETEKGKDKQKDKEKSKENKKEEQTK